MKFCIVILFLVGFFSVNGFEVDRVNLSWLAGIGRGVESLIHPSDGELLLKLSVGTPSIVTYVMVDTGSDLTWIQCKPCIKCFSQNTPLFDPRSSATYRNISCSSPTCQALPSNPTCSFPGGECQFSYSYSNTMGTVGVLATETFDFQMANRGPTTVTDFPFGCGHDNLMPFPVHGSAGVMGIGRGYLSIVSQLGRSGVDKKFSYCFPGSAEFAGKFKIGVTTSVFVTGAVVSTPMLSHERYPNMYFVTMEGISVGSKRIESQQMTIDTRNTVMNSGSSVTYYASVISVGKIVCFEGNNELFS